MTPISRALLAAIVQGKPVAPTRATRVSFHALRRRGLVERVYSPARLGVRGCYTWVATAAGIEAASDTQETVP